MAWDLEEAIGYYRSLGAPRDQNALVNLLKEVQQASSGIPMWTMKRIAAAYGVKDSLLLALIRRIPGLRLEDTHTLELCAGPNCSRHKALAEAAEKLDKKITVKFVPCMRHCGQGPNLRWDGTLYNRADEALLKKLTET